MNKSTKDILNKKLDIWSNDVPGRNIISNSECSTDHLNQNFSGINKTFYSAYAETLYFENDTVCVCLMIGNCPNPNHYISHLHFHILLWRYFRDYPNPIHISNIFLKLLRKTREEQKEAATRGVLENFANFTGKNLCLSIF